MKTETRCIELDRSLLEAGITNADDITDAVRDGTLGAPGAIDDRVLWTFQDESVRFYFQVEVEPEDLEAL